MRRGNTANSLHNDKSSASLRRERKEVKLAERHVDAVAKLRREHERLSQEVATMEPVLRSEKALNTRGALNERESAVGALRRQVSLGDASSSSSALRGGDGDGRSLNGNPIAGGNLDVGQVSGNMRFDPIDGIFDRYNRSVDNFEVWKRRRRQQARHDLGTFQQKAMAQGVRRRVGAGSVDVSGTHELDAQMSQTRDEIAAGIERELSTLKHEEEQEGGLALVKRKWRAEQRAQAHARPGATLMDDANGKTQKPQAGGPPEVDFSKIAAKKKWSKLATATGGGLMSADVASIRKKHEVRRRSDNSYEKAYSSMIRGVEPRRRHIDDGPAPRPKIGSTNGADKFDILGLVEDESFGDDTPGSSGGGGGGGGGGFGQSSASAAAAAGQRERHASIFAEDGVATPRTLRRGTSQLIRDAAMILDPHGPQAAHALKDTTLDEPVPKAIDSRWPCATVSSTGVTAAAVGYNHPAGSGNSTRGTTAERRRFGVGGGGGNADSGADGMDGGVIGGRSPAPLVYTGGADDGLFLGGGGRHGLAIRDVGPEAVGSTGWTAHTPFLSMLAGATDPRSGNPVTASQFIERLGEARRERDEDAKRSGLPPPSSNQAIMGYAEGIIGTSPVAPKGSSPPSSEWAGGPSVLLGGGAQQHMLAASASHPHLQFASSSSLMTLGESASASSLTSAGGMGDAVNGQYHPNVAFGARNPKSPSAAVSLYTDTGSAFKHRHLPVPKGMSSLATGSSKELKTVAEQVRSRTNLHAKNVAAGLAKSGSAEFRGVSSLRRSASMASTGASSTATTAVPRPLFRNESGYLGMTPSPSFTYGGRTSGVSGFA